jgi:hypothetical protein
MTRALHVLRPIYLQQSDENWMGYNIQKVSYGNGKVLRSALT